MHFVYARDRKKEDFEGPDVDHVLIDKGDSLSQFDEMVRDGLRPGDVLTVIGDDIPEHVRARIEFTLGVAVKVHEKEPKND